jgi:hypothetical protein
MGFCIYNNVGVAAKWVLQKYPHAVRRILIIDWDVQYTLCGMSLIYIVMAMGLNEYFTMIQMFCIFLSIDMMMEHFVPPLRDSANKIPSLDHHTM